MSLKSWVFIKQTPMKAAHILAFHPGKAVRTVFLSALMTAASCTPEPLRPHQEPHRPETSYVTETRIETDGAVPKKTGFKCSFIEFDQNGDFLKEHINPAKHGKPEAREVPQLDSALAEVRKLARGGRPPLVVFYCHGWHNSAQSNDVLRFHEFLRHLAELSHVRQTHQVHGIYLSWKANPLPLAVKRDGGRFDHYVKPQVSSLNGALNIVPAFFSYWSAKNTAENKVSGAALTSAVFQLAYEAKKKPGARVCIMGHSFGALTLERALLHGYIGLLTAQQSGGQDIEMPFDLMLFINSAAHATEAKQQMDFLGRHPGLPPSTPLVISLQSRSDFGTETAHQIGNAGAWVLRQNWREYGGYRIDDEKVYQGYFRARTPGNAKYLVTHRIFSDSEVTALGNADVQPAPPLQAGKKSHEHVMLKNLIDGASAHVYTSSKHPSRPDESRWTAVRFTPELDDFRRVGEKKRQEGVVPPKLTPYWIISVPEEIIGSHTDIWNKQAVELYVKCFAWSQAGDRLTTKKAGGSSLPPSAQPHLKDRGVVAPLRLSPGLF